MIGMTVMLIQDPLPPVGRKVLKIAQEVLPSPEEMVAVMRPDWSILKPVIHFAAKCEELLERITVTLSIMTGQHPLIAIDPQRVTNCTSVKTILPSAGEYWSSGSMTVADRIPAAKESQPPGSSQDLSGTFTYPAELRAADYEICRRLCQKSTVVKPCAIDRNKDQTEFSQAFFLTVLPMELITELIMTGNTLNFTLTVYSAMPSFSRFVHMGRFQQYLDDRCGLLALPLPLSRNGLDTSTFRERGPVSFMLGQIQRLPWHISDYQFQAMCIWDFGKKCRVEALLKALRLQISWMRSLRRSKMHSSIDPSSIDKHMLGKRLIGVPSENHAMWQQRHCCVHSSQNRH